MKESFIHDDSYLRIVIDALPTAVFVVDKGFKIFDLNPSAKKLFGIDSDVILRRLCGEILHCMHAIESKCGCGTTEYCSDCVLRNSVEIACKGETTHRKKYKMTIQENGEKSIVHTLVTASPFRYKHDLFLPWKARYIENTCKIARFQICRCFVASSNYVVSSDFDL